ncbi:protein-glutamate methylesterase/protein-glutamine glutaminase [Lampropedia aestuarii]|uniref:protein-glutamate methylesterase/protein-glutamine glutaminase n=1 Tax=Lampropedia aestuarii TaxID=2562762 RepID=UPI0024683BE3|nr:chemotaxis response regulator protein-glutamate methylesterase [Lampropedia aestuarii]MDH5859107.1 chemotaxis response regulator protein-glutamate methylesterase [Lampropedia aestuarii]
MSTTLPHETIPTASLIKVLVVDDSALVRQLLKTIIDAQEGMQCIGVAKHADMALRMVKELHPDVMTLDVEMPGMSGLQLLRILMHSQPLPVIMVSSLTLDGAQTTLDALELGALDFVTKPSVGVADGLTQLAQQVVEKIRTAATARIGYAVKPQPARRVAEPAAAFTPTKPFPPNPLHWHPTGLHAHPTAKAPPKVAHAPRHTQHLPHTAIKLIAIGASTGGTDAIRTILQAMPALCPPIAIVQHMPAGFTRSFAERLNSMCAIEVHEAEDGERLQRGHAYIAPGGRHLRIRQNAGIAQIALGDDEPVLRHRPSVDALFRSIPHTIGATHCVAALLTGMGADGAAAMLELRLAGAHTIAQDAESCVVYGMPREAALLGAASEIRPLAHIAQAILDYAETRQAPLSKPHS